MGRPYYQLDIRTAELEDKLKTLCRNPVLKYTAFDLGVFLPQSGS